MALSYELDEQDGVLTVRATGERPAHDVDALEFYLATWTRVAALCRERGIRRIVYLVSSTGRRSSAVALNFYSRIDELGFDRTFSMAVVFQVPDVRRVQQLGIDIAAANGWNIKAFDSQREALDWLARQPA
jgi:hypothetical protein